MSMTFPPTPVAFPHSTLGYAQVAGYSLQAPNALDRTEVMDGPPRFRMIGPSRPWVFDLQFKFSRVQFAAWQEYYHNTLFDGQRWSEMTLSMGAGNWQFAVHGTSRYQATRRGRLWVMIWNVEGLSDDPNNPLPWQVDVINAGGAYTPAIDTVLSGNASDPSSGVVDGGTAN